MKKVTVNFHSSGNTSVFWRDIGGQIPELQVSWLELYLKFITEKGFDVNDVVFVMPNRRIAVPFEVEGGFNWELI